MLDVSSLIEGQVGVNDLKTGKRFGPVNIKIRFKLILFFFFFCHWFGNPKITRQTSLLFRWEESGWVDGGGKKNTENDKTDRKCGV